MATEPVSLADRPTPAEESRRGRGRLDELTAAVAAAKGARDAAAEREWAEEYALHYAHQAARAAPPAQHAQVDAWCAAAADQLHRAILDARRATARLQAARAELARYTRLVGYRTSTTPGV
jgi:hypothetical protein